MSCRRAYELDLPAFVIDPRDPAWDDFRAHYPTCDACAAEVATWTTLQAALVERHPEPADLLRWHDAPDTVAPQLRATIGGHVARCATCRDELRALDGFTATGAASASASTPAVVPAPLADAVVGGGSDASPPHHASASRAGGRHAERHAFGREGAGRSGSHVPASGSRGRSEGRRGPVARVLLHPAFAYAVLALALLLPTVRAALDRDAGRGAFDVAASRAPERIPGRPQPITAGSVQAERNVVASRDDAGSRALADRTTGRSADASAGGAAGGAADASAGRAAGARAPAPAEQGAAPPDDAHVDRTAPRLVRQAPFRQAPPPPPPAAAPVVPAARPAGLAPQSEAAPAAAPPSQGVAAPAPAPRLGAAKAAGTLAEEARVARDELVRDALPQEAPASTAAGSSARQAGSSAAVARSRAPGDAAPLPPIRLLPAGATGRTLVVSLPASAAAAADVELRIVDARGGRELRQRVARAAGPGGDVQITLPAGFTGPVLQVEVYADGAGPVLQGSVTP